jgi:hypothetical protein
VEAGEAAPFILTIILLLAKAINISKKGPVDTEAMFPLSGLVAMGLAARQGSATDIPSTMISQGVMGGTEAPAPRMLEEEEVGRVILEG